MEEVLLEAMAEIPPSAVLRLPVYPVRSGWIWSEARNAAAVYGSYCQSCPTYSLLANPRRMGVTGTCDGLLPTHSGHSLCPKADSRASRKRGAATFINRARTTRRPSANQPTHSMSASPGSQAPARTPSASRPRSCRLPPPVRSRPTCRRCPLGSPMKSARISQLPPTTDG
jgi:hypothetical protein